MMAEFQKCGGHHGASDQVLTSAIIDFERAIKKQDDSTVDVLAAKYDELVMMDEVWTSDLDPTPLDEFIEWGGGELPLSEPFWD